MTLTTVPFAAPFPVPRSSNRTPRSKCQKKLLLVANGWGTGPYPTQSVVAQGSFGFAADDREQATASGSRLDVSRKLFAC